MAWIQQESCPCIAVNMYQHIYTAENKICQQAEVSDSFSFGRRWVYLPPPTPHPLPFSVIRDNWTPSPLSLFLMMRIIPFPPSNYVIENGDSSSELTYLPKRGKVKCPLVTEVFCHFKISDLVWYVWAVLLFQNADDDDSSVTETSTFSEVTAADEWETETPKKKTNQVARGKCLLDIVYIAECAIIMEPTFWHCGALVTETLCLKGDVTQKSMTALLIGMDF